MNKLVSIIVPVYNVSTYLKECLDSLINQTYKNIEIILVDDGSTDDSFKICKSYADLDKRIKLFKKVNGGAASARNLALDKATGYYICFVDSDDYVELDYVHRLVEELEKNDADVAICSYSNLDKIKSTKYEYGIKEKIFTAEEYIENFLTDWTSALMWNKIFKRELIGNIRFPVGHKIDDEFFTYQCIMKCKKIYFFNEFLYIYRLRQSSVMNDSNKEMILKDRLQYLTERYDNVITRYPKLKIKYLENLMDNFITIKRIFSTNKHNKIYKCYVRKYAKEILSSKVNIKQKLIFIMNQIYNHNINSDIMIDTSMYFE